MRIAFSVLYSLFIAAFAICIHFARKSHKSSGKSVALLLTALIPPMVGNLIIIISSNQSASTVGYYIFFLGMDFVMYALVNFTHKYCSLGKFTFRRRALLISVLAADAIQILCNPFSGHAFGIEGIEASGAIYYRLVPHFGQTIHRVVDYAVFAAVLVIFIVKIIRSPKINAEKYLVILFTMVFTAGWQTFYIFSRTPVDRSIVGYGVFGLLVFYLSLYYRPMRLLDRMLATIASKMPEALFFFDNYGKCIWANEPAKALAGISEDDFEEASVKLEELFGGFEDSGNAWTTTHITGSGDAIKSYVISNQIVDDGKGRAVGSFITIRDNSAEQKTLQREIYNATHDELTGLYNRAGYNYLTSEMKLEDTMMLMIDGDHFKSINDTYGHEIGDRVIKKISASILAHFRSNDYVCRVGGDEFVVLMTKVNENNISFVKDRITKMNEELSVQDGDIPAFTVSAGCANGKYYGSFAELFDASDRALYETKRAGRKGFTYIKE